MSMFALTNARGETVDINNDKLLSYTPTGLGVQFTNTYSQYETYFKATKSTVTQGQFQIYILFGDVESQAYQTFSDFAQFLAYQPLTLTYTTDSGTWYRDGRLNSLTKTEIGGSTVFATDRINESFTLEFINNWYNNKSAEYKSYDPDPNLGTYGKIYRPKYELSVGGRNYLAGTANEASTVGYNYENQWVGMYKITLPSLDALYKEFKKTSNYFTLIFDWKYTGTNPSGRFIPQLNGEPWQIGGKYTVISSNNTSGTVILTASINSDWSGVSDARSLVIRYDYLPTTGTVTISNMRLLSGNMSYPWTPAPEDNLAIPFGYAYVPYYVYQESNRPSNEKVMSLNNQSQYFGIQSGSPSVITIKGPCSVNPTWTVVQKGNVVATDGFVLTLTDNQKLVVSSYPEDQYARLYNPDGSFVDVSQLQDYTKTNFVQIPEGESTVLFYLDADSDVNITFKEERLLV
ncbi:phage baseplate protein [Leuconostoc falkenbergense]|uniref:phage distal tail protein domain-containing protein n=1 Tax=Leuconostoc falkenbergense TaxID=2766470 RepID=UPI002A7F546E|nr:phage distal tail protein domain-containing protein [Leuconostoc falkenbergense]MDY5164530.1 phage baseplate protein [Leuconostoc falkenbergense]